MRKLVRDKIPLLMFLDGEQPKIRKATKEERLTLLRDKLVEEAHELKAADSMPEIAEEIADVWEVLQALIGEFQHQSGIDLVVVREDKRKAKGKFEDLYVWETPDGR